MLLLFHIAIALSSMAAAGFLYFAPSKLKLKVSYSLVALTLGSGTYLVWTLNAPMVKACATGLIYLAVVSAAIIAARHKLAKLAPETNREQ